MLKIFMGRDARETVAYTVAEASVRRYVSQPVTILPINQTLLQVMRIYTRPTVQHHGQWYDVISEAPMSTEHAIARFFVPYLAEYRGWALFVDGDILVRKDLVRLFDLADEDMALQVVQHHQMPDHQMKKAGQLQQPYMRKNWSSVMLINCAHPVHRDLTLDALIRLPGRDLHRFCWVPDDLIGSLPPEWNWLAGVSDPIEDPAIVHYTLGTPLVPAAPRTKYDDEWVNLAARHVAKQPVVV